tara:strand:+ start:38 stop:391 length:354 start_codon:yes stop_codon:yes gene_type:complete
MSKINYSHYDGKNTDIPPPPLNAGLYTGERFAGPWGNVDIKPDVVNMTRDGLKLTEVPPPPEAFHQFGDIFRPGNNEPNILGSAYMNEQIGCVNPKKEKQNNFCFSYDPWSSNFLNL